MPDISIPQPYGTDNAGASDPISYCIVLTSWGSPSCCTIRFISTVSVSQCATPILVCNYYLDNEQPTIFLLHIMLFSSNSTSPYVHKHTKFTVIFTKWKASEPVLMKTFALNTKDTPKMKVVWYRNNLLDKKYFKILWQKLLWRTPIIWPSGSK